MNNIIGKIKKIKYLRMDKNEKYLLRYLTNYTIVPYEENKNRIFYKVNGKIQFEYNIHSKILFINDKISDKITDDNNDKRRSIANIVSKYLNIEIVHTWTREYNRYKLWRELSDDV